MHTDDLSTLIVCIRRSIPSLCLPLPLFLNRMSYSNQKLIQCFYQFTTRVTFHSVILFSPFVKRHKIYKSIPTLIIWHLVLCFFLADLLLFSSCNRHIFVFFHSITLCFAFFFVRLSTSTLYIWCILFSIFLFRSIELSMPKIGFTATVSKISDDKSKCYSRSDRNTTWAVLCDYYFQLMAFYTRKPIWLARKIIAFLLLPLSRIEGDKYENDWRINWRRSTNKKWNAEINLNCAQFRRVSIDGLIRLCKCVMRDCFAWLEIITLTKQKRRAFLWSIHLSAFYLKMPIAHHYSCENCNLWFETASVFVGVFLLKKTACFGTFLVCTHTHTLAIACCDFKSLIHKFTAW